MRLYEKRVALLVPCKIRIQSPGEAKGHDHGIHAVCCILLRVMPLLLAIETSQRIGGVALREIPAIGDLAAGSWKDKAIHVEMLRSADRHDDDLLPAIDRLFGRLGLTPRDLGAAGSAVAVSIGPGGFTGLRIGVSTAKMFAEVLGVKVIAVPSALVAAEAERQRSEVRDQPGNLRFSDASVILVALACKGETCWCTRLQRGADQDNHEQGWRIIDDPATGSSPGIADANSMNLAGVDALLGDEHLPQAIRARCEREGIPVIEPVFDPRACLIIAQRMVREGLTVDPLLLAPLYPRQPEAVTLWEKRKR